MNTKKARNGNSRYLRCKVEDFTGAVECVMWPDDFVRYKDEVQRGPRLLRPRRRWSGRARSRSLILNRILSLEQAQRELARGLYLLMKLGVHGPQHVEALAPILTRAPGGCPVFLTVRDAAGKKRFETRPRVRRQLRRRILTTIWRRCSARSASSWREQFPQGGQAVLLWAGSAR